MNEIDDLIYENLFNIGLEIQSDLKRNTTQKDILGTLNKLEAIYESLFFKEIHYSEIIVKFLKNFPFSMNFEKR